MKIGKAAVNVLKRSVLRQINAKREEVANGAGIGEDCAIFAFSDGDMTVSCVQEAALAVSGAVPTQEAVSLVQETVLSTQEAISPVQETVLPTQEAVSLVQEAELPVQKAQAEAGHFAERRTMAHLIQKCANNLAVKGAEPVAVLITLLLPEDVEESVIKGLMAEADSACEELHMQAAGGQTRITAAVTLPYGVVTGIGKVSAAAYRSLRAPAPGQDVVISKWIGLEGTAYLVKKHREKLSQRYPAWLIEEAAAFDRYLSILPEAATAMKSGVCAMHDVSEGGIFGALWELAESAGVGLTIDLKKLPLRQETVEVCECCNVNPYELLSGGCLLMTCGDGSRLVSDLEAEGIPAMMVGKVTDSNDRILINGEEIRYMDRPQRDEIYRLN